MKNDNPSSINLINHTVINVLMHSVATNDIKTLNALGVSVESVKKLGELSLKGRYLLGESPAPIIQTNIDNQALYLYTQRFLSKEEELLFINQLILADAPFRLLKINYGFNAKDYLERRIALGMNNLKLGRPSLPDIDHCPEELSKSLEGYILDKDRSKIEEEPQTLIALSDEYKISIREILGYFSQLSKELM